MKKKHQVVTKQSHPFVAFSYKQQAFKNTVDKCTANFIFIFPVQTYRP